MVYQALQSKFLGLGPSVIYVFDNTSMHQTLFKVLHKYKFNYPCNTPIIMYFH